MLFRFGYDPFVPLALFMCEVTSCASLKVAITTCAPSSKNSPLFSDFEPILASLSFTGVLFKSESPLATDKPEPKPDVSPLIELVDG